MRIKLKRTWFAPDQSGHTTKKYIGRNGKAVARGHRLRMGIHDVPSEWRDKLPSDAEVLADDYEEPEEELPEVPNSFYGNEPSEVTEATALTDGIIAQETLAMEAENARQAEIKKQRIANMARAREAKQKQKQEKANA